MYYKILKIIIICALYNIIILNFLNFLLLKKKKKKKKDIFFFTFIFINNKEYNCIIDFL